jgi:8-oxo-dGTP diphosphatase
MNNHNEFRFAIAAVDAVIFAFYENQLHVLVRPTETETKVYQGKFSLPGSVMRPTEEASDTLDRVIKDKTGLSQVYEEQLYTFTAKDRDVRSRAIAIAYLCCVPPAIVSAHQHRDARFVPLTQVPTLAYDHDVILATAHKRLASKLLYTTIAKTLLPKQFTLSELQSVYEGVRRETLDKRNFRKKFLSLGVIEGSGEVQQGVANRPAALYTFVDKGVTEIDPVA